MSKHVIVTGAAGHMGMAVVHHLLDNGNTVVGTVSPGKHHRTHLHHERFEEYEVDVSDPKAVGQFVKQVVRHYHRIDFAALLAGGFSMGDLHNTSLEDIHQMLQLNFETAFTTAQAVFKQMEQQSTGGHIMFVGAKPALEAAAGSNAVAYAFSKSLIFRLADYINVSGIKNKIKASVIVPSILDSPPNRTAMPDANFDNWVKPEEVAAIVGFLVSEQSVPLKEAVFKIYGNV